MFRKTVSLILSISLIITQLVFAQGLSQLNLAQYLGQIHPSSVDSFRPAQLRYVSYDVANNDFKLLLDRGDELKGLSPLALSEAKERGTVFNKRLQEAAQEFFNYFLIGLSLPNDKFWVNLRPDAPEQIIDPLLEKTDLGRILLEADLKLKKDTASFTSPKTPEGKQYWDKLYKKAGELFGTENITIPTITRPWIVPGEVIVRESEDSAYIYKANLKVMLEEDYLTDKGGSRTAPMSGQYTFSDPRMKELNKYSTELIKELILPRLTQEVNTSKKYAQLRQVFFSLILSRWFKDKYKDKPGQYSSLIDSRNLDKLTSKEIWNKDYYFNEYKRSFQQGEYNLKEQVSTPTGQVIRSYVSGGIQPVPTDISSFKAGSPILTKIQKNALIGFAIFIAVSGAFVGGLKYPSKHPEIRKIQDPDPIILWKYDVLDEVIKNEKDLLTDLIKTVEESSKEGIELMYLEMRLDVLWVRSLRSAFTILDKEQQNKLFKALNDIIESLRKKYSKSDKKMDDFLNQVQELLSKESAGSSPLVPQEAEARFNRIIFDYKASIEVFIKEVNEKAASWSAKKLLVLDLESFVKLAVDGQLRYQNSDDKTPLMMGRIVIDLIMAADGYIERMDKDIEYAYDSGRDKAAEVLYGCRKTMEKFIKDLEGLLGDLISDIHSGSSPLTPEEATKSNDSPKIVLAEEFRRVKDYASNKFKSLEESLMLPKKGTAFERMMAARPNLRLKGGPFTGNISQSENFSGLMMSIESALQSAPNLFPGQVNLKRLGEIRQDLVNVIKPIGIQLQYELFEYVNEYVLKNPAAASKLNSILHSPYLNYRIFDELPPLKKNEVIVAVTKDVIGTVDRQKASDFSERAEAWKVLSEFTKSSSSALTEDLSQTTDSPLMPGGIDFRKIEYLTRPMGSFQGLDLRLPLLSKAELEGIDINKELASVEQIINAKIEVSTDRLKRLLAAMSQKDAFTSQRETKLLPLLLRLCWLKEEKGTETTPDFRAVLLIADTGLFVEQGNTRYSLN